MLDGLDEPTKDRLLKAMEGHILEQTELIGTYQPVNDASSAQVARLTAVVFGI